jgi:hypothetical protein
MSIDQSRVVFKIRTGLLAKKTGTYLTVLTESFSLIESEKHDILDAVDKYVAFFSKGRTGYKEYITFVCTAAQFGRFLVIRNNAKLQNTFKELEPQFMNGNEDSICYIAEKTDTPKDCVKSIIGVLVELGVEIKINHEKVSSIFFDVSSRDVNTQVELAFLAGEMVKKGKIRVSKIRGILASFGAYNFIDLRDDQTDEFKKQFLAACK